MSTNFPEDFSPAFAMSVGYLVMYWAFVEQNLDFMVSIVHQRVGGRTIEQELPRTFKNKEEYLRRSFAQLPTLIEYQGEVSEIRKEAKRLAKIRHFVVHGTLTGFNDSTGVVKFSNIKADADFHREEMHEISIPEMLKAGDDCSNLTRTLLNLNNRLADRFVHQNQDNNPIR